MTSQARIEANRKNARRSTGPRTEAGKARAKFNALKHGLAAATVVLPHEDAGAYEQRLAEWTAELRPSGALGRYLAERAVRLSWQLDRADAHDTARLARRAGQVSKERERSRRRRAEELVRRVLGPGVVDDPPGRGHAGKGRVLKERPDDPARWLARLKTSLDGCVALRAAWDEVAAALGREPRREGETIPARLADVPFVWALTEPVKMLRLLGVRDDRRDQAAAMDPRVRRIIAIEQECVRQATIAVWQWEDARRPADEGKRPRLTTFRPDPALPVLDEGIMRRELLALAETERGAVSQLIERHEAAREGEDGDQAAAVPDAFDDSAEGERLHRYQTNWSRSLLRTLDALGKLRSADEEMPERSQTGAGKIHGQQEFGPNEAMRSNRIAEDERGGNNGKHEAHEGGGRQEPRTERGTKNHDSDDAHRRRATEGQGERQERGDHESRESGGTLNGGESPTAAAMTHGMRPLKIAPASIEASAWLHAPARPVSPFTAVVSFLKDGP